MAGGTGGHVFPALAVAAEMSERGLARGVARVAGRHGGEPGAEARLRDGVDPLLGTARKGAGAHGAAAAQPAHRLLAERARDLPRAPRRGAGHGRLRVVSGRNDGRVSQPAAGGARAELHRRAGQPGAGGGRRPPPRPGSPTCCASRSGAAIPCAARLPRCRLRERRVRGAQRAAAACWWWAAAWARRRSTKWCRRPWR